MVDFHTRRDAIKRTYRKQINADTDSAVLGLPTGLIPDVYKPGNVWIQITSGGGRLSNRSVRAPTKYFNLAPGTPVKLKYDNRGRLQIDEVDADLQISTGVDPVAQAIQASSPSTPQSNLETLRLIAKSGLLVSLKGWNVISGNQAKQASYSDIDLSSYVPAAVAGVPQMLYAGIFVKADFTDVDIVTSTPRATSDLPLNAADESEVLAAATPGDTPAWAVKLVTGQTTIAQANIDNGSGAVDWRQIVNTAQSYGRTATATSYAVLPTDNYIGVTNTGSAWTLTLPAANAVPAGKPFVAQDESGGAATHNITVQRAGSDTVNGGTSATISANYGRLTLYSNGVSSWFSA